MNAKTLPPPISVPIPPLAEPEFFPPSAELGEMLQTLAKAQAEIDRKKADELAQLRAIQDRD